MSEESRIIVEIPEKLRKDVIAGVKGYMGVRKTGEELAPQVYTLWLKYKADHVEANTKPTAVHFVRAFDESVPLHFAEKNGVGGYPVHKSYKYIYSYLIPLGRSLAVKGSGANAPGFTARKFLVELLLTVSVGEDVLTGCASLAGHPKPGNWVKRLVGAVATARIDRTAQEEARADHDADCECVACDAEKGSLSAKHLGVA